MSIILFMIILLVLVLVHEAGHFFTAKFFGIRVDEFGFGFPPKIFGIKRGETEYTFNLFPLGGFVKIWGENGEGQDMSDLDRERSFINKPKWQQAIVLFAGVFMNFVLAWVLFSFGFMSGLPTAVGSQPEGATLTDVNLVIVSVVSDSPAQKAGLKSGDKIISMSELENRDAIEGDITPDKVKSFIVAHGNEELEIGYIRGSILDNPTFAKITPVAKNGLPAIGIAMDQIGTAKLGFFSSIWEGLTLSIYTTKTTAVGLYSLVRDALVGKGSFDAVTGPVGMVGIVGDAYKFGLAYLLSFAALISINLAIVNLLPFPALDGGRLLFLLIEKIKGGALSAKFANTANMIGFAILITLMVVITYHDVMKLML